MHVDSGLIREMRDPQGKGHTTFHAYVKVRDLPLDLPLEINPRAQNTQSRVARQIENGLIEDSDVFHLLNRGITMTALDASYSDKKEELTVEVAGGYYGVLDGGHTYRVITKNVAPYLAPNGEKKEEQPDYLDSYVRMEVLTGIKSDLLVDIARARNTSAQVRDESLANLEGSFDWLKDTLKGTKYAGQIAYRENEDDDKFPIDVREIVALLTLFHPKFQDPENPPIMGYTSKGRCLELFRTEEAGYQALKPIIPDVLEMYDYVHGRMADVYRKIGGFGGIEDSNGEKKTQKGIKLAKVTGVKAVKEGFPLYYSGGVAHYRFPDGWLFPMVAALRGIVSYKTVARWKADPKKFFDKVANSLVKMTLETSISLGRNPNAVGKSKPHWVQMHERVMNTYLRLLNTDTDKDVIV